MKAKKWEETHTEEQFKNKFGHSSLCNCIRRWRGRLIVTVRSCDCKKYDEKGEK